MNRPAQFKYILFSALFLLATVNFIRTTYTILQSSKRLESLEDEVSLLDAKKEKLQKSVEYKKTSSYIEETARNALNMVKPGEKLYVSADVLGASNQAPKVVEDKKTQSNVEKWLGLVLN